MGLSYKNSLFIVDFETIVCKIMSMVHTNILFRFFVVQSIS